MRTHAVFSSLGKQRTLTDNVGPAELTTWGLPAPVTDCAQRERAARRRRSADTVRPMLSSASKPQIELPRSRA